jgi:hypothetical protein
VRRLAVVCTVVALALTGAPARALPPQAAGAIASDNVEFLGTIPEPGAFGARIIGDAMYVTTTQGLRVYSVSDVTGTGLPVPVGALNIPHFGNEDVDTNGEILLIATDHALAVQNMLYVIDVTNPHVPTLLSAYPTGARAHTVSCIKDCSYGWLAGGDAVTVIDLRNPAAPQTVGRFYRDGSTNRDAGGFGTSHDVEVDAAGIAWVSSGAGLFGYDPSANPVNPRLVVARPNGTPQSFDNQFIIHNSMRPDADLPTPTQLADDTIDPGEIVYVTEEDWIAATNGFCAQDGAFQTGWYHVVNGQPVVERLDHINVGNFGDVTKQKPLPLTTCSSHYFDVRDGVAAVSWYEQGIRFFDVSDPRDIRTIGWFTPLTSQAVAAKFHRGYLYTFDLTRGIDVLRFNGQPGDDVVAEPPLRSIPAGQVAPDPVFGYACRVLT